MANFDLFTPKDLETINAQAAKSKQLLEPVPVINSKSINSELNSISKLVLEYFKDSKAELITDIDKLIDYIDHMIEAGEGSIDTETTGLDRQYDTIVGSSLYYPGGVEVYIPNKHMIPIFNEPQKNQLTYEQAGRQFQRLVDAKVKIIFANADFDLSMIYKDYGVDLVPAFYYDVLLAWRCLKENERDNSLKGLFNKYVLKGQGDPKHFTDFFSPTLFPYCDPAIAKYYAANDPKITYELYRWQLPFVTKDHKKCIKNNLQQISDLIWSVEFPLVGVCQKLHRTGVYLEQTVANHLDNKYDPIYASQLKKLHDMVQAVIDNPSYSSKTKRPFARSVDFNPASPKHVSFLCYNMLKLGDGKTKSTDKDILGSFGLPITDQILKCRSLLVLINTFVKKLPKTVGPDSRIHCQFKQIGADTGRMCIAEGSLISAPGGDKCIEDMEPGDYVYTYTESGKLSLNKVVKVWPTGHRSCVKLKWVSKHNKQNRGELICTSDHSIRTTEGWIMAKDLKPSHQIFSLHKNIDSEFCYLGPLFIDPSIVSMLSIEYLDNMYDVYDLEVEDTHNFIANELCVHNSSADPNMQNIPSKITDIRHMFRATPGYQETRDCESIDDKIDISLMSYEKVKTVTGDIAVHRLSVGDSVILLEDGKEVILNVKTISDTDYDGRVHITF